MKKKIILFTLLLAVAAIQQVFGQQTSLAGQIDSIEARLPQLQGEKKLEALRQLITLFERLPEAKQYVYIYLNEAQRQKDIEAEAWAWRTLSSIYYSPFDTDSLFIIGEQAIRFARKHEFYDDLFFCAGAVNSEASHGGEDTYGIQGSRRSLR